MNNVKNVRLDDLFVMHKGDRMAVCALHTHDLGWECRLLSGDDLIATSVCRTDGEIETFVDTWRKALESKVDLIRFGGHLPKGGYDVQTNGRQSQAAAQAPAVRF